MRILTNIKTILSKILRKSLVEDEILIDQLEIENESSIDSHICGDESQTHEKESRQDVIKKKIEQHLNEEEIKKEKPKTLTKESRYNHFIEIKEEIAKIEEIEEIEIPQEYSLQQIRAKFRNDMLELVDIENIKKYLKHGDRKTYYLVLAAAYEKLGLRKNAFQMIRQMEHENIEIKGIGPIKQRLRGNQSYIFKIDVWDKIIGWDVSKTEEYEEEKSNANNAEENNIIKREKHDTKKIDQPMSNEKIQIPQRRTKEKIFKTNADIVDNNKGNSTNSNKKKHVLKKRKDCTKKTTILQTISTPLKEAIKEINCKYYIKMQPANKEVTFPKRYYQSLEGIKEVNGIERTKRIEIIQNCLKDVYKENKEANIYIKKYDKLQSILECSSDNKRAKMELILVLINEGYAWVAKSEFGKDYMYIEKIIKQYKQEKMTADEVKNTIDEYCL